MYLLRAGIPTREASSSALPAWLAAGHTLSRAHVVLRRNMASLMCCILCSSLCTLTAMLGWGMEPSALQPSVAAGGRSAQRGFALFPLNEESKLSS